MLRFIFTPCESTREKIVTLLAGTCLCLLYLHVVLFLQVTFIDRELLNYHWEGFNLWSFIVSCIMAPIWEEVIFRHYPLQLAKKYSDEAGITLTAIASSVLFGYVHGSAANVFIQGVGGLIFCAMYIKNNYNLWTVMIAHSLWNFCLMFLFPFVYK